VVGVESKFKIQNWLVAQFRFPQGSVSASQCGNLDS